MGQADGQMVFEKRGADMWICADWPPTGFPSFLVFLKEGFGGLKHAFLLESILIDVNTNSGIHFVC